MIKHILMHNLEKRIKEIYENYNIIKKIDFKRDIDAVKSDRYEVDNDSGELKFLFSQVEKVNFEDYKLYKFGDIECTSNGLQLMSSLDQEINDSIKRAQVFVKKSILSEKTPIIYIDFDMNKDSILCVRFGNQFFYNTCIDSVEGKIPFNSELKKSNKFKRTESYFTDNYVSIHQQSGNSKVYHERDVNSSIELNNGNLSCIFDIKRGCLYINKKKQRLFHKGLIGNDKFYMSIACNSIEANCTMQPEAYIKEIAFAKEDGFVYLNPIYDIKNKKVKVMLFSSKEITLQYYNQEKRKWVELLDSKSISNEGSLELRIPMSFDDRIYNIFILEKY